MKRWLALGLAPLGCGVIAAYFRARELAFSFDFTTGLPTKRLVATPVIAVGALALLALVLLLFWKKPAAAEEERKHPVLAALSLLGCATMIALAAVLFMGNRIAQDMLAYVQSALALLCAVSFALLGIRALRANQNGVYSFFAAMPVFWACFSLILIFREKIADPIIADYVFLLFSYICILMFCYAQAGYVYRKNRLRVAVAASTIGSYFAVVEVLSPYFAWRILPQYAYLPDFAIILPLLLFALYMPVATACMLKNENDV